MADVKDRVSEYSFKALEEDWARRRIEQWLTICNEHFLKGSKTLSYNSRAREVYVLPDEDKSHSYDLSVLSAGEKQVVAILAYVILSELPVFLILDEPELSLSEDWQRVLMEQLQQLNKYLAGVVIASHSSTILRHGGGGHFLKDLLDIKTF